MPTRAFFDFGDPRGELFDFLMERVVEARNARYEARQMLFFLRWEKVILLKRKFLLEEELWGIFCVAGADVSFLKRFRLTETIKLIKEKALNALDAEELERSKKPTCFNDNIKEDNESIILNCSLTADAQATPFDIMIKYILEAEGDRYSIKKVLEKACLESELLNKEILLMRKYLRKVVDLAQDSLYFWNFFARKKILRMIFKETASALKERKKKGEVK